MVLRYLKLLLKTQTCVGRLVNNPSNYILTTTTMPPIRSRKSRARYFTPPLELTCSEGQIKTPQRYAILIAKVLAQELNI